MTRDLPALLARADQLSDHLTDLTVEIASVPAPTGDEGKRSDLLVRLWRNHGLEDVSQDELGNVVGSIGGSDSDRCLLIVANMDYAYPAGSEVAPYRDGSRIVGTGVYDNGAGLVVSLGAASVLAGAGVRPPVAITFAATVAEEWGGNLAGMRALVDRFGDRLVGVINIGHDVANVHHVALGATTLRLEISGPGGHSYAHIGTPSAVHALVSAMAGIVALPLPEDPRTSLNVGVVNGGTSGNGIAEHASAIIEFRSLASEVMSGLEQRIRDVVADAMPDGLEHSWTDLDRRPYGSIPAEHPLVEMAAQAHREVGLGVNSEIAAADFSLPLSMGIPSIVNGAATGGGVKTAGEYLEAASLVDGVKSLVATLALLSDHPWLSSQ